MIQNIILSGFTMLLCYTSLIAQKSSMWSRDQKNTFYNNCMDLVRKEDPTISSENREEFCYCYLNKVTNDFSYSELNNLIEPEVKRLTAKYYSACSASTGVSLSTNNGTTISEWTKDTKNEFYNGCIQRISKESPSWNTNQTEEFCYCYLDKLTKNHQLSDIQNMITPELRRLTEKYYSGCLNQAGVRESYTTQNTNSSNFSWTKDRRSNYFRECQRKVRNNNPNLSGNNIDSYCICFLNKLTNQYSYQTIQNMIGPEYKNAAQDIYDNCSISTGIRVSFNGPSQSDKISPNAQSILGTWVAKDGKHQVTYNSDGTYYYESDEMNASGKWKLENEILETRYLGIKARYRFLYFSSNYIKPQWLFDSSVEEYYKKH